MSELLIPPEEISDPMRDYGFGLSRYTTSSGLPEDLLVEPDHLMIKAANPIDFGEKVRTIKPWSEQLAFVELNWRFLAMAQLIVPWAITSEKRVGWLEVMEPREARGYDHIGVEYASFYYSDINKAERLIKNRNIPVERYHDNNRQWRWLNIVINDAGQELRLSDKKLATVFDEELDDETARYI